MEEIWTHARDLRHRATDAERHLWRHLRGRRLDGFKFRRQYPIAGFIADFVCIERRLVVELDGGQHVEREAHDAERTRRMMRNGYRVVRFWNDDVLLRTEAVLEAVLAQLHSTAPSGPPLPDPPLPPEGRE